MPLSEMDQAARQAIEDAHALTPLAERCAAVRGWSGGLRDWRARCSRWGNPHDAHTYPAWAIPLIIEVTGLDPFTTILVRTAIRRRRPAVRRVRPRGPGAKAVAA